MKTQPLLSGWGWLPGQIGQAYNMHFHSIAHLPSVEVLVMETKNLVDQRDTQVPEFDPLRAAELIETCRAHAASVLHVADTISQALHEFYEYEIDEPHLGICFDVVRESLDGVLQSLMDPVNSALPALSVVTHDSDSANRATEISAGFEQQRKYLLRARHVTLATIYVMRISIIEQSLEVSQTIEALRDMEEAIKDLIDGLDAMTLEVPTQPLN